MAHDISNYIKVTIPIAVLHRSEAVSNALELAVRAARGATSTESNGLWFDGSGRVHEERVRIVQLNFHSNDAIRTIGAVSQLVNQMFLAGEEAVMRERYYSVTIVRKLTEHRRLSTKPGYDAGILYAPPPNKYDVGVMNTNPMQVLADDSSLRHLNS